MSSPESIARIVTRFDRLRQLTAQATRLKALNQLLTECLPEGLAAHAQLAAVRDGCVVLQAENAAWAAQLRYKAPQILARLAESGDFGEIRSVRVRNSMPAVRTTPAMARPVMSRAAGESISMQAAEIADPALREALLKLAARARK